MRKIYFALVAASVLAASALPATATEKKIETGVVKHTIGSVDFSARRYHRRYRHYAYRPYYRPYYRPDPYYAYGPGPYYYGRPYYNPRPFPFGFFPFF
ncbi:MAG: hypothetical protein ABI830_04995 [Pseudolabrys sp.]